MSGSNSWADRDIGFGVSLQSAMPWFFGVILLWALPYFFTANSSISILNQMAITIVFALSYNMLLGQTGMLSFGHSVYMGLAGFACLHVMNFGQEQGVPIPLPVLPLISGMFAMGVSMVVGAFSTRRSGVIFAMISLGVIELVASFSIITKAFFGFGGAGGDRTLGVSFFGVDFAQQIEMYYLISGWLVLSILLMYLYTRTPLGRMSNAVRDNAERAEFLGFSSRLVRFYTFSAAGFFAGVAGGLSAINYEIATAENLTVEASGTILMIAFLGGVGHFFGPIIGAIVFTVLQTVMSLHTELWQLYIGILFLATVMYFPNGFAGVLAMHVPVLRSGKLAGLIGPYVKTVLAGCMCALACAALLEMIFHSRKSAVGNSEMTLFWVTFDNGNLLVWGAVLGMVLAGFWAAKRNAPQLAEVWRQAVSSAR